MHHLACTLAELCVQNAVIPQEDGEIYAYGFECMLATLLQLIVFTVFGLLLHRLIPLALFALSFTAVKRYIGGYHAQSHLACVITTTVMGVVAVLVCACLPVWGTVPLLLAAACIILAVDCAPNPNNPLSKSALKRNRKCALIATAVELIAFSALFMSPFAPYAIYGACGLLMAACTLFIPCQGR